MKDSGIALIMTLFVMVLLSSLAMNLSLTVRQGSASTRNLKEDTIAYYLASSAVEDAIAYLSTDKDIEIDFVDKDGNFRTDAEREPITGSWERDGALVSLMIEDEESRLNINSLSEPLLRQVLVHTGITDEVADELSDTFFDWTDPDDLHHLLGAEDEYYGGLGYRSKNAPLDTPEELLLIKGFTSDYYYGTEEFTPLEPLITTWGQGININTVKTEVLEALGLTPLEIDALVSARESIEGFRAVTRRFPVPTLTTSSYIRIVATAKHLGSPLAIKVTSIVKRRWSNDQAETTIEYWKEDIESSGT